MRKLKSVLIVCIYLGVCFTSSYGQSKDNHGNSIQGGVPDYPSGSIFNSVNVNTGFHTMMTPINQKKKSAEIKVDKQQEDSTIKKEIESLKFKNGGNKSEKVLNIIADSILQEGLLLYRLERMSWVSTDLINTFKSNMLLFNGYISFFEGDSIKTIYYNHDSSGTKIKFDASINIKDSITEKFVRVKRVDRIPSKQELLLIELREEIKTMMAESPSMSENMNKVMPNIDPIVMGDKLYFYVLPGSFEQKSFYMGGDYIFEFTYDKKLLSIHPQHKSLLRFYTLENTKIITSYHTHINDYSGFITATDICQAKLYGKLTIGVTNYVVNSAVYSSDYNTETDQLIITDNYKKKTK